MKFTLKIDLGNDAMQTPQDVARALAVVGAKLMRLGDWDENTGAPIMDENGNKVGKWEV